MTSVPGAGGSGRLPLAPVDANVGSPRPIAGGRQRTEPLPLEKLLPGLSGQQIAALRDVLSNAYAQELAARGAVDFKLTVTAAAAAALKAGSAWLREQLGRAAPSLVLDLATGNLIGRWLNGTELQNEGAAAARGQQRTPQSGTSGRLSAAGGSASQPAAAELQAPSTAGQPRPQRRTRSAAPPLPDSQESVQGGPLLAASGGAAGQGGVGGRRRAEELPEPAAKRQRTGDRHAVSARMECKVGRRDHPTFLQDGSLNTSNVAAQTQYVRKKLVREAGAAFANVCLLAHGVPEGAPRRQQEAAIADGVQVRCKGLVGER